MPRTTNHQPPPRKRTGFDIVLDAARSLPDLEESTTWGARALKVGGRLLACEAIHRTAEPGSIVVRVSFDQRAELIEADPDVYYVTEHYVNFPSVLVRVRRIHRDALRDLLGMAWQSAAKGSPARKRNVRTRKTPARARRPR